MVRGVEDAVKAANVTKFNEPGMCQKVTRGWFAAGSVGDVDGDGDADAVDGWKYEKKRHTTRAIPFGAPVAWSGGSGGFGHRAICIDRKLSDNPMLRSTDAAGRGKVGNRRLSWFEDTWNLKYLGWSETISGIMIPGLVVPGRRETPKKKTRGTIVDRVIIDLGKAKVGTGDRAKHIKAAQASLKKVPYL